MQHNTYYSAIIDILAMADSDIGCQESTKHYGSLLEAFSTFSGLFPVYPLFLMILEVGLISILNFETVSSTLLHLIFELRTRFWSSKA